MILIYNNNKNNNLDGKLSDMLDPIKTASQFQTIGNNYINDF